MMIRLSRNTIIAGVGAIIVLVSLVFPWYELQFLHHAIVHDVRFSIDASITDLISADIGGIVKTSWIGSALPVIAVIIFASIGILSVIYSLLKNVETTRLWSWLGILSVVCIIINALYLIFRIFYGTLTTTSYTYHEELFKIIDFRDSHGMIMAIIGAVLMVFSNPSVRKAFIKPIHRMKI